MEYYIYHLPVFIIDQVEDGVSIPEFCAEVEKYVRPSMLANVDVVYIGNFKELLDRNAAFTDGAIYMKANEPTIEDMLENFIHELAHSLEIPYAEQIFSQDLRREFLAKRHTLYHLLNAEGYHINPRLYSEVEYNPQFDRFLADEVGYPLLLTLTLGLFASPYGATSLQEYFANGFEKYYLGDATVVKDVSPVLYGKIEEIVND